MTQGIQQAIGELQSQLKYHQEAALRLTRAIENLREISAIEVGSPKPIKGKRGGAAIKNAAVKAKPAKAGKRSKGKTTLSQALLQVMEMHRKAKRRGVAAKQLMEDLIASGFRFGSSSPENNMNYLYKTLRRHKAFKRVGDGLFGLA